MGRNTWLVLRDESKQPKDVLAVQEDNAEGRLLLIRYRKQLLRSGGYSNIKIVRETKPELSMFQKMMATLTLVEVNNELVVRGSQTSIRRILPNMQEEEVSGLSTMMLSTAIEALVYLLETVDFTDEEDEVVLSVALDTLKGMKEEHVS